MTQLRRVLLYELFIGHYVQLARDATAVHRSHNQALIYLRQAGRLCTLLADDDRREQAASQAAVIATLQQVLLNERQRDADAKPMLPQRESGVRVGAADVANVADDRIVQDGGSGLRRVRAVLPTIRPSGAYTNVSAIRRERQTMATKGDESEQLKRKQQRVKCDVHEREKDHEKHHDGDDDDDGDDVFVAKRPQTPIGAASFFDDDGEDGDIEDGGFEMLPPMAATKAAIPSAALVLSVRGQFELRCGSELLRTASVKSEDVTAL